MIAVFFQIIHLIILWIMEFYPYPELVIYPYLRSLGWLPYKQIIDQHFPGLMFFPVNLNSLGFSDPFSLKVLLILVVLLQSTLIFRISRSWIAVALYSLWQPFFEGSQLWIDLFLPLFTLPAFIFFEKKKWFWSGLFLGLGVIVKQTLVPLVVFAAILIIWHYRGKSLPILASFGLATLIPAAVMLIYFGKLGILPDFWFWTFSFNLSQYAKQGILFPTAGQLIKLVWPIAVITLAAIWLKNSRKDIGWMVFSIIGGIARFGFIHLQPAVPFFVIIYSLLVNSIYKHNRALAVAVLLPSLIYFGFFLSRQKNWLQTKFYSPTDYQIAGEISQRTHPGDEVFLLGVNPHIYQMSSTIPPGKIFVFQFPWFLDVAGEKILSSLSSRPPRVIAYDPKSSIDGQKLDDYAFYLVKYIQDNYRPVQQIGTVTIYENRH